MIDSWEKIIDNNFISAELIGCADTEKIVTIKDIDFLECYDEQTKSKKSKQSVIFEECKPLVLNKTNSKALKKLFSPNEDNPNACIGKRIVLRIESIRAFGKTVDAIRIKEYSETKCADCGAVIVPVSGKSVQQLIEISERNCNKVLCVACMKKYKEDNNNDK